VVTSGVARRDIPGEAETGTLEAKRYTNNPKAPLRLRSRAASLPI
jgi:hypothetical protein